MINSFQPKINSNHSLQVYQITIEKSTGVTIKTSCGRERTINKDQQHQQRNRKSILSFESYVGINNNNNNNNISSSTPTMPKSIHYSIEIQVISKWHGRHMNMGENLNGLIFEEICFRITIKSIEHNNNNTTQQQQYKVNLQ
ncbi:hypothetical protein ACTA71_005071 [Dictyostelium dimigraforme]